MESKHSENMFALQGRYEEEIRCVVEQLNRAENTLQAEHSRVLSQLDASVRDRQDMERHHVEQMQTLENKFQLKVKELQTIHEEELRTLQEHYSQNMQGLQETLRHYQRQHPETLQAPSPPGSRHQPPSSSWPASPLTDAVHATQGEADSMSGLRERIQELEAQVDVMREELEHRDLEGDAAALRDKYQQDFENLKVLKPCFICKAVEGQALSCLLGVSSAPDSWGGAGRRFLALNCCISRIEATFCFSLISLMAVVWPRSGAQERVSFNSPHREED